MKFPRFLRSFVQRLTGLAASPRISFADARVLASREAVVFVALGARAGNLPGEERTGSLSGIQEAVKDLPKDRPIITHCG
jgi:hypothetical protein